MSSHMPHPSEDPEAAARIFTWAARTDSDTLAAELARLSRVRRGALARAEFAAAKLLARRSRIIRNELERRRRAA